MGRFRARRRAGRGVKRRLGFRKGTSRRVDRRRRHPANTGVVPRQDRQNRSRLLRSFRARNRVMRPVTMNKSAMPEQVLSTHVWEHEYDLTANAGTYTAVGIRANSVYDPWLPTAQLPSARGYASMSAIYGRYTVLAMKYTVVFLSHDSTNTAGPAICGTFVRSTPTIPSDRYHMLTDDSTRFGYADAFGSSGVGGGGREFKISGKMMSSKMFSRNPIDHPDDSATIGADPAQASILYFFTTGLTVLQAAAKVHAVIYLTYDVLWTERITTFT